MIMQGEYFIEDFDYYDLKVMVRSILVSRSRDGATIEEIKSDYYKHNGEHFPEVGNMTEFLLSIPEVLCYSDRNGTRIFNVVSSERSEHLISMIRNQKPAKPTTNWQNRYRKESEGHVQKDVHLPRPQKETFVPSKTPTDVCFFEDNYQYLKNSSSVLTQNMYTSSHTSLRSQDSGYSEEDNGAHLYDYQLLGDDFFLSMARMELNCKFHPGRRILQSGLCISGQTISEAAKRILTHQDLSTKIIVNIGSVDILHGRELIDIQHDFHNLLRAFDYRGIRPVITTLAPLANLAYRPTERKILESFNDFIRKQGCYYQIIDLWECMVNQSGHILFECYQNEPRKVTGSSQPHAFWNKLGRQRILKQIKVNVMLD